MIVIALLAALVVPLLMTTFASPASADEDDKPDNYSLYQLASNASSYFSAANSPDGDKQVVEGWDAVTQNPGSAGSMLGYADPDFSLGNIVGWFFAEVSGSSQTVKYSTFSDSRYSGMLDYAEFNAANADLGLDTMSSGIGGQIVGKIGGGIMWLVYILAIAVGSLFYFIMQLLQLINPFKWFYDAVAGSASNGQEMADGMTGGDAGGGALAGLQNWITSWYGLLQDISWEALVPLFIGFLLIGLVLFKKMDRGAAIKKLIVRIVFIGVGLPLIGSMYTGVLDKFSESAFGSNAGPTRVVLSNYVDYESWMMENRLAVPNTASITWDGAQGQAGADSAMAVRETALAINKQSHGDAFAGIDFLGSTENAEEAWSSGTVDVVGSASDDVRAVFSTFGIIGSYFTSREVAASDFESGIKTKITELGVGSDDKKGWFVDDQDQGKGYDDAEEFGKDGNVAPSQHPVISVDGGLAATPIGDQTTKFTTPGQKTCDFAVTAGDTSAAPSSCNLSPLAAFNVLNSSFGPDSLTMFSSNNATSGFTRENHMAVSQVGTGPAKFMYWSNSVTLLASIALLGFWYAIGMLAGAVKRTFSLVAAIPFATLGAIQGIAKVIVYSVALILEVIVTLFIYQFVSQFLISIPGIIAGPLSAGMGHNGLFGSPVLGGIIVIALTMISTLVIIGVTFALLKVRKVVLQAMDEVFTKLVDKFLDTNTAPNPAPRGSMMPDLASGIGAGAGMALGNKLAARRPDDPPKPPAGMKSGGTPGSKQAATNVGGTNGEAQTKALSTGGQKLALGPGHGGEGSPGSPAPNGGPGGGKGPDGGGRPGVLAPGSSPTQGVGPDDRGGPLQLSGGEAGSTSSAKQLAQSVSSQGGLSNLGFDSPRTGSDVDDSTRTNAGGTNGAAPAAGSDGTDVVVPTSGARKGVGDQDGTTQFGTGKQGSGNGPSSQRFSAGGSRNSAPAIAPVPGAPVTPGTRPTRAKQGPTSSPTKFGQTTVGGAPQARPGTGTPSTGLPRPAQGRPAPTQFGTVRPGAPAAAPRQAQGRPVQGALTAAPSQPRAVAQRPQVQAPRPKPAISAPAPAQRQTPPAPSAPNRPRRAASPVQAPAQRVPQPQPKSPARPRRAADPAPRPKTDDSKKK